ncbi:MAG: DNA translocase FtsK 4TM domain-containing protein [Gammaproteobacteria bacterium]|nr:DNA translocase FtsK 4TM domain-containing protein [Gammaproteobacteria bacterium]
MRDIKRKPNSSTTSSPSAFYRRMHEGLLIVLSAAGAFLLLSLVTYHRADPAWSHQVDNVKILNAGGRVGAWLSTL